MDIVYYMLFFGCNMFLFIGSYWFCDEGICIDKVNILYVWVRNVFFIWFFKGVGFRVGGEIGSKYFVLQVYYGDISVFRDNYKDCFGVFLYFICLLQFLIVGMYLMMFVDIVILVGEKVVNFDILCYYKNYLMYVFVYRVYIYYLGKVVSGYRVRNGQWILIG